MMKMKKDVILVNTSRGGIINEQDLYTALKNKTIGGAALDVFEEEPLDTENPLISMDNVILTPHLAASSEEAMRRMAVQVCEGVLEVLRGEAPEYPVVM
jgi:D-3-phosphoglycerate dehydrogenase